MNKLFISIEYRYNLQAEPFFIFARIISSQLRVVRGGKYVFMEIQH